MPTWRRDLPTTQDETGFRLKRTPITGTFSGIITCEQPVITDTHYWHGRTMPCERQIGPTGHTLDDSACPACLDKQSYRTHCYVSAFVPKSMEHVLFECTANAAVAFMEYLNANGSLRGCGFHAGRDKPKTNAKVVIVTKATDQARNPLPNAPDVIRALAVIWRLPATAFSTERTHQNGRALKTDPAPMRRMREQIDNAGIPPDRSAIEAELKATRRNAKH